MAGRPRLICLLATILVSAAGCDSQKPNGPTEPTPNTVTPPAIPDDVSAAMRAMLVNLTSYIAQARQSNVDLLPRNPQSAAQLQAKIAMLENPSLAADIINGRRWNERVVTSINGRAIPIDLVFPLESMRPEASTALDTLAPILPLLEAFFAEPFPTAAVRVWYGFVIGNSGGGGTIYSEDRTTYESRTGPTRLPFDAILGHELGHSYIGNEALNQFLELYTYNVIRTGSTDVSTWPFTRGWVPGLDTNIDVSAVLDIYQFVGYETMARAYRAIRPLHPAYGAPLTPEVIQAFVAQVPSDMRELVSRKLAQIRF